MGIIMMPGDGLKRLCMTIRASKVKVWSGKRHMTKPNPRQKIKHSIIHPVIVFSKINDNFAYIYHSFPAESILL